MHTLERWQNPTRGWDWGQTSCPARTAERWHWAGLLVFPAAQSDTCMGIPKEVWYLNVLGVSHLFLSCCLTLYNFLWYKGSQCNKCFPGACSGALSLVRRVGREQDSAGLVMHVPPVNFCCVIFVFKYKRHCIGVLAAEKFTGQIKRHVVKMWENTQDVLLCEKYKYFNSRTKITSKISDTSRNPALFEMTRTDEPRGCFFCVPCCLHSMGLYFFTTCKLL